MLLQMALFHFLWLSNTPLCLCGWVIFHCVCIYIYVYIYTHIYIIFSLSIHLSMKIRLFPCLDYCTYCCHENRGACILLNYSFVWVYWVGLLDHMASLFLGFYYYYNFCSELFKSKLQAWCPLTPKYFTNYCLRTRTFTFITRIQW